MSSASDNSTPYFELVGEGSLLKDGQPEKVSSDT